MITYVINTSENKTFDSELLFDLAGYSKIRWIQSSLSDIKKCAEDIYEKQNVLGADMFRIAVIIDFYNFDKIRLPYGRLGYGKDFGVEASLYMPYVEVFLLDNLISYLEFRDMMAVDFEIYYVQNERCERYDNLKNEEDQLKQILKGTGPEFKKIRTERRRKEELPEEEAKRKNSKDKENQDEFVDVEIEESYYKAFRLYCTEELSLDFELTDYPYGADSMTFSQFLRAFSQRLTINTDIRRHYYISSYGGGASRAAFNMFSLSLYLIHVYEREETVAHEGDMEVIHLEPTALKDVIEESWRKVNAARKLAKKNNIKYYVLDQNPSDDSQKDEEKIDVKEAIAKERASLPKTVVNSNYSGEKLYSEICGFASRTAAEVKNRNRKEFDKVMSEYLRKRDDTRENSVSEELEMLRVGGYLKTTEQSPSQNEYENIVLNKQKEISDIFKKVLNAEYNEVDYADEKKAADEAFAKYRKAKACMQKNVIGDLIFMLLAVAAMVVPYTTLQLFAHVSKLIGVGTLLIGAIGIFAGLFILAVMIQILPLVKRLQAAKSELKECYLDCYAKENYSFSSIRRKYEKELVDIERARYELRQVKQLYDENHKKNLNVRAHRRTLERLEDCLAAMLNNLDIEPRFDADENVDGELDLGKPIKSKENRIYKIFSIETIEKMFPRKGRDEN